MSVGARGRGGGRGEADGEGGAHLEGNWCGELLGRLQNGTEAQGGAAACSGRMCTLHGNTLKLVLRMGSHRKVFLWRWASVLGGSSASPQPRLAGTWGYLLPTF